MSNHRLEPWRCLICETVEKTESHTGAIDAIDAGGRHDRKMR
jgi:hypothetical protein